MTGFNGYSEYKDTGLKWLGRVPAAWGIVPLWTLYSRGKSTNFTDEELLSVYRDHGVVPKSSRDDNFNKPSEDLSPYQLVRPGDMVINKMKAWQGSVAISRHRGIVSPAYFVYERHHTMDDRYLHYLLRSERYIAGYLSLSKGIRINQWDLDPTYHSRMPVLVPSMQEQRAIVDLLDRETAQIDNLIGKQERLIELLAERRRTTINEAYAWEAAPAKLRHVVQFAQTGPFGTQLSAEEYIEDGVPVINPTHIQNGEITPDLTISVTPGKAAELARHRLMKGDIILGRKGEVDKSARATRDSEGFVCGSDSMLLRPKTNTDSDYLWWFFQSPKAHAQLELWSVGSTVAGLNQTTMSKIRLPLPSPAEQRAVARLLAGVTSKIDRLMEKTAESVVLLRERRSALISAAATGKINVTNEGVAA